MEKLASSLASLLLLFSAAMPALANPVLDSELVSGGRVVRRIACYARSSRGFTFEAIGITVAETEKAALDKCYKYPSEQCFSQGCRSVPMREGD